MSGFPISVVLILPDFVLAGAPHDDDVDVDDDDVDDDVDDINLAGAPHPGRPKARASWES